jgi:CspA family cold shock protein
MTELQKGIVRWYNPSKGFGFIRRENLPDIFAHYSRMDKYSAGHLKEGNKVEFYIIDGLKGIVADRIKVVSE